MSFRTHPEYVALYKAVCADPGDDTVRLALADWLEEYTPGRVKCVRCDGKGEGNWWIGVGLGKYDINPCYQCEATGTAPDPEPAALAEFIRAGVELARRVASDPRGENGSNTGFARHLHDELQPRLAAIEAQWGPRWRECPCPACGGEGELVDPNDPDLDDRGAVPEACPTCRGTGDLLKQRDDQQGHGNIEPRPVTFARGFVDSVSCTLAGAFTPDGTPTDWAAAVVGAVPATRLVLRDVKPTDFRRVYGPRSMRWSFTHDDRRSDYYRPGQTIPTSLWLVMQKHYGADHDTEAAAVEALARGACRMVRNATSEKPTAPAEQSNAG